MYNWDKQFNQEPPLKPEKLTLYERAKKKGAEKIDQAVDKYGKFRCFLAAFGVLAVIYIAIVITLNTAHLQYHTIFIAFAGLILLFIGLASIVYPIECWKISHMFSVSEGEPTDFAVFGNIVGGILIIIAVFAGIFILLS